MFTSLNRRMFLAAAGAIAIAGPLAAQEAREIVEMSMGAADAPVTLIEYASFTCPHCADFNTNVMPEIKAAYIDTGKVRLIYREVFFDRPGLWAAMIARCAGPDRYFGVVDLLYRNQAKWTGASDAQTIVAELYSIGRQAGMTDDQMNECLKDGEFAQALVTDYQKNVEADGVEATPTFIMNGEKVSNMPWPEFQSRIESALES
jgi:protein-disulfide isomerase